MPKAKKLPSGNWRVRAYDKETKKYRSFTAETKKEAELMTLQWLNGHKRSVSKKTVGECIDDYIASKENILSPTTISSYRVMRRNDFSEIENMKLQDITAIDIQQHINRFALDHSPKTVRNVHGLLMAALKVDIPDFNAKVTLPPKQKKIKQYPNVIDVVRAIRGTEIELPCMLAIWEGLRMSEIRGIRRSDIKDGILTIHQVVVTVEGQHIAKERTKTEQSTRQLRLSPYILDLIDKQEGEYIAAFTRNSLRSRFLTIAKHNNLGDITFHDLRHLNASVMLMLGIPDKYAMERGGWSSPNIMKSVYQHTFSDERKIVDDRIDEYFTKLLDDTENK